MERSERIVRESAEQCERTTLPKIAETITFEEMLAIFSDQKFKQEFEKESEQGSEQKSLFVLDPAGEQFDLAKIFGASKQSVKIDSSNENIQNISSISFCVGPEGGWSPKEIDAFKKAGVPIYAIGESILRAETAAIACASLILLGGAA